MNATAPLAWLIERCDLDCVLVAGRYTLLDDSAANSLLPLCLRRGVAVLAGGVFNRNSRRRLLPLDADTRRAMGRAEPGTSALTGDGGTTAGTQAIGSQGLRHREGRNLLPGAPRYGLSP